MMQSRMAIVIAFIFLGLSFQTFGQKQEDAVRALFSGGQVQWVKHFQGRVNDVNDILITLGTDGKNYKGIAKFLRSKETFRLDGRVNGSKLSLRELDKRGNVTGRIKGEIKDHGIIADWYNHNKSIGLKLELFTASYEPEFPTFCGDNKWIRFYEGSLLGDKVEMIVQSDAERKVKGQAYFTQSKKTYTLKGIVQRGGNYLKIALQDENLNSLGAIEGTFSSKHDIDATFYSVTASEEKCNFVATKSFDVGCIEYADYFSTMDILYPKTQHAKFNKYMVTLTEDWKKSTSKYTSQYAKQRPNPGPSDRFYLRSSSWYELSYVSDKLISGLMTQSHTWEEGFDGFSFNFDLKKGKAIKLEDVLDKRTDYGEFLRTYILKELKQRPYNVDPNYFGWVQMMPFEQFTIQQDGITFHTMFNSLYGRQSVMISYDKLEPYLQIKNPIKDLLN